MKISERSWHYKVAKFGAGYRPEADICGYLSNILAAIFKGTIILFAATFTGFLCGDFIAWLIVSIEQSILFWPTGAGLVCVGVLAAAFLLWVSWVSPKLIERSGVSTPQFVKAAWRSWREKVCILLEFTP